MAGPSGHTRLWLGLSPPTPASHAGPETQLLACLRLSKGHVGPSLPARMPLRRQPPPRDGASRGRGPVCSASIPPDRDSRLPRPPSPDFCREGDVGQGTGVGPRGGLPPPRVLSSDAGSASLPFPVASSVRQTLSTPGGALPPRLPQTSASLVKSPELAGKARELCRGNRHDSSPSALILS